MCISSNILYYIDGILYMIYNIINTIYQYIPSHCSRRGQHKSTSAYKPLVSSYLIIYIYTILVTSLWWLNYLLTGAFYIGNGWVAGGCWDDYY